MVCVGEQESGAMQLDMEISSVALGTPPIHQQQVSSVPQHPGENEAPGSEIAGTALFSASSGNYEDGSNIQGAELSKNSPEYHTIDNQCVNPKLESQVHGDSTLLNALSPGSENILQNANITTSTLSPEVGGRFIQHNIPHEDVMDEIKSTFKFAKNEITPFSDKTFKTSFNRHPADTPKFCHTVKRHQILSQCGNASTLPLRPVDTLDLDESSNNRKYSGSSHSTSPEIGIISLKSHFLTSFHKSECQPSEDTMPQGRTTEAGRLISQEIDLSSLRPNNQSPILSVEGGLNSQQSAASEHQEAETSSAKVAVFDVSHVIPNSDTDSRPQLSQKAVHSHRIRIKQPFPEVAKSTVDSSNQIRTPTPNRDEEQCERFLNQPSGITDLCFSDIRPNSLIPSGKDMAWQINSETQFGKKLQSRITTSQLPGSQVSGCHRSDLQRCSVPLNKPCKVAQLAHNLQDTNSELTLVEPEPEVSGLPRDSTLYISSSHDQRDGVEETPATLHMPNLHEQSSTGPNSLDDMAISHVTASIHSDNRLSTSEEHISVKSSDSSSSSESQPQTGSHLIIPLLENVSDACDPLQPLSKPQFAQYSNNTRVKKPKSRQGHKREAHRYSSPPAQQLLFCKVVQAQQNLIKHSQEIEHILNDCQHQKEVIQFQQSELDKFKASSIENYDYIRTLEKEKEDLKAKIKKFEQLSVKYKNHMNEVVMSQKHLLRESQRIQKVQTDMKSFQEAYVSREAHIKKLECLLHEAKEFRAPAEKLLVAQEENRELMNLVQEYSKTNQLLQNDLDKNVIDLGRERHNSSQLQKQLNAQIEAHKEHVEQLKSTRFGIVEELTSESGMLVKILHSERSTQEKIEQLLSVINIMNNHEKDFRPILGQLVDNLSFKIDDVVQATETNGEQLRESYTKHLGDLKERINEVRLHQKTESQLNDVITDLRETNIVLSSKLGAREAECQGLTTRLSALEIELTSCRSLLGTKCDELAVALALPKDDPKLRGTCQDLEDKNLFLQHKVDAADRETSNLKEELATLRETSLETERQLHRLRDEYDDAQSSLQKFAEEKQTYMSNAKLDIERARQDVAKASIAAKNELIMRHDALVKNLEQRRAEAESQVTVMKEELQQMQGDRESCANSTTQLQRELSACRAEAIQQSRHIKQLEMQSVSRELLERQEASLKCALGEIAELRTRLERIQTEATRSNCAVLQSARDIEHCLRQLNDQEHEKESLREQNIILQEKYDALSVSTAHLTQEAPIKAAIPHNSPQAHEVQRNGPSSTPINTFTRYRSAPMTDPRLQSSAKTSVQLASSDIVTINHVGEDPDSSSLQELPYKQLKVANRNARQSESIEAAPPYEVTPYSLRQSTVIHSSQTTHEIGAMRKSTEQTSVAKEPREELFAHKRQVTSTTLKSALKKPIDIDKSKGHPFTSKRNDRKRAASSFLADEDSLKPWKAPRTSLHFKSSMKY